MAVDLGSWASANSSNLASARSDFLDALSLDENFINTYEPFILPDPKSTFVNDLVIALEPIDELQEAISEATFVLPDQPAAMQGGSFERETGHVFEAELLNNIENQLGDIYGTFSQAAELVLDGQTLERAIQSALYREGYELDKDDLAIGIDRIAAAWQADGYEVAPGAMAYEVANAIGDFDRKRTEKNSNTFTRIAGVVQSNMQKAFENGISIERLHQGFTNSFSELAQRTIQASISAFLAEVDKRRDEFSAELRKISTLTAGLKLDVQADIKKNELELSEAIARTSAHIQNFGLQVKANASLITDQISVANNIVSGHEAIFSAYGNAFMGLSYEKQTVE